MTSVQRTLLIIAIFLVIGIGSFIWFIANWDKDARTTFGAASAPPQSESHSLFQKHPGGVGGWPPVPNKQQAGRLT